MHRGIQDFVKLVQTSAEALGIVALPPASNAELAHIEQTMGSPLPEDLRLVLLKFNGATLPSGALLSVGSTIGKTIEAVLKELADREEKSFLDPEALLPFHRSDESILAFDRSAGPVADTWPIVDFYSDTGEIKLVHRTFDGWCRLCVAQWTSPDWGQDFTLDVYLRNGERHVAIEPDVASAHATVAHAYKRAGQPEQALASYLAAARCVPPEPRCDWEALKIAVLIDDGAAAVEAATRLASRAPPERWLLRETTPGRIADLIGMLAVHHPDPPTYTRLLDLLAAQAMDPEDHERVAAVRRALLHDESMPETRPSRPSVLPQYPSPDEWWAAVRQGYADGAVRDEDLLLDPSFEPLRGRKSFAELLRIRRDF